MRKKGTELTEQNKQQILKEYLDGSSRKEIVAKWHVDPRTLQKIVKFYGFEMRPRGIKKGERVQKKHPRFKGKYTHYTGYVMIKLAPDHPYIDMATDKRGRYVPEHRLVMAEHLGRPLTSKETVHHINGDRSDNNIENLQLRKSHHGSGQLWECLECGSFNIIPRQLPEERN